MICIINEIAVTSLNYEERNRERDLDRETEATISGASHPPAGIREHCHGKALHLKGTGLSGVHNLESSAKESCLCQCTKFSIDLDHN